MLRVVGQFCWDEITLWIQYKEKCAAAWLAEWAFLCAEHNLYLGSEEIVSFFRK